MSSVHKVYNTDNTVVVVNGCSDIQSHNVNPYALGSIFEEASYVQSGREGRCWGYSSVGSDPKGFEVVDIEERLDDVHDDQVADFIGVSCV